MVAEHDGLDGRWVRMLLVLMFFMEMFINYDSGAVPAVLSNIIADFHLEPIYQGLLGGLTYVGLTVAAPAGGFALQRYSAKTLLCFALFFNATFTALFALSWSKPMLLLFRAGIGASQAVIATYAPVWVDEFAPADKQTRWMSLLQGGAILGVMVGYTLGGYMTNAGIAWEIAILVQAFVLTVLASVLLLIPRRYIDSMLLTPKPDY